MLINMQRVQHSFALFAKGGRSWQVAEIACRIFIHTSSKIVITFIFVAPEYVQYGSVIVLFYKYDANLSIFPKNYKQFPEK